MSQFDPAKRVAAAGATARFEALDSWRGICALMVALMHFPAVGPIAENPLVRHAFLFVDYFFVLSGFVIAHAYRHRLGNGRELGAFLITRFGRIYPLHAVVLAIFVVWELLRLLVPLLRGAGPAPFTGPYSVDGLANALLLLNGLGFEPSLRWNSPSWSISSEFWTYVLFGLAVMTLQSRYWLALLPAVALGPVALLAWSPDYMDTTVQYGFIRCLYGFSLGALVYLAADAALPADRPAKPSFAFWTMLELAILAVILVFVALAGKTIAGLAAPWVFAVAVLVFSREGGAISRLLRLRPFLWLGSLSYAIYMVHIFVQSRMINLGTIVGKLGDLAIIGDFTLFGEKFYGFGLQGPVWGTLYTMVMVVVVIAFAFMLHLLVERPFIRISKRAARAYLDRPSSVQLATRS